MKNKKSKSNRKGLLKKARDLQGEFDKRDNILNKKDVGELVFLMRELQKAFCSPERKVEREEFKKEMDALRKIMAESTAEKRVKLAELEKLAERVDVVFPKLGAALLCLFNFDSCSLADLTSAVETMKSALDNYEKALKARRKGQ